ncbi:MAG: rhodoquinone biosynthesis methyltransferase RquA [Salaquimonas sp.]|nr:rhodoquinone biosynthesis methyltransferase RquA [Salaquimonas sp.]
MDHAGAVEEVISAAQPWLPSIDIQHRSSARLTIPHYIEAWYRWAYLDRRNARLLDRESIVSAILLGNSHRLRRAALSEIEPGQRVLQAAHVYGRLIPEIAHRVGPDGSLDVIDIVPLQVALCRRKLQGMGQASARIADATDPGDNAYDVVNCYFLLHEVPDDRKRAIVDALLRRVAPGGRAVFIDYHRPKRRQPLRGFYRLLFRRVEPFALSMWNCEIHQLASEASAFRWNKKTMFGGVFQKTVACRKPETDATSAIDRGNAGVDDMHAGSTTIGIGER